MDIEYWIIKHWIKNSESSTVNLKKLLTKTTNFPLTKRNLIWELQIIKDYLQGVLIKHFQLF